MHQAYEHGVFLFIYILVWMVSMFKPFSEHMMPFFGSLFMLAQEKFPIHID